MQTKKESFKEACVNVAVGYIIAVAGQLILFPIAWIESELSQNLFVWAGFTIISLVRSYIIRRIFNNKKKNYERSRSNSN